jgi:hypothetical protein
MFDIEAQVLMRGGEVERVLNMCDGEWQGQMGFRRYVIFIIFDTAPGLLHWAFCEVVRWCHIMLGQQYSSGSAQQRQRHAHCYGDVSPFAVPRCSFILVA